MSASFYDLLKFAKTGVASPSMTHYDKLKALSMCKAGFPVKTLTGVPPLTFKSDGTPLISWSMLGNGSQTGTPTPSVPIMPEFVGVRTGNLFDDNNAEYGKWVNSNGTIATNAAYAAGYDIKVGTASEFAIKHYGDKPYSYSMAFYDSNGDFLSRVHRSSPSNSYDAFPVPENAISARFQVAVSTGVVMTSAILKAMKLMLNSGSTALPYEPFGYKIPISCAEQTTPVYLGEVPTVRRIRKLVLTGEEGSLAAISAGLFRVTISGYLRENDTKIGICSHFDGGMTVSAAPSPSTDNVSFLVSGSGNNFVYFAPENISTLADFKQWISDQYAAGHPVTVWYVLATEQTGIVNEPLCKISTYADELRSGDAAVTIPTAKGQNTLSIGTTLQPSEVSITGGIK